MDKPEMGKCVHEATRAFLWSRNGPGGLEEVWCCDQPHAVIHRRLLTLKGFSPNPVVTTSSALICCCGRMGMRPGGYCLNCYGFCPGPKHPCRVGPVVDLRPTPIVHNDLNDGWPLCGAVPVGSEDVHSLSDFGAEVASGQLSAEAAVEAHWKRITCQWCLQAQLSAWTAQRLREPANERGV